MNGDAPCVSGEDMGLPGLEPTQVCLQKKMQVDAYVLVYPFIPSIKHT